MRSYPLASPSLFERMLAEHTIFPGAYRLHFLTSSGAFDAIPRLFGIDSLGILYIGAAANVPARIWQLRQSVAAAYKGEKMDVVSLHPCGKRIIQCRRFMERFPFEGLSVSFTRLDEKPRRRAGDHSILGAEMLDGYFSEFGDSPPLNR